MKEDIIKEINDKLEEIEPKLADFYEPTEEELAKLIENQNKKVEEENLSKDIEEKVNVDLNKENE